jgi:hypothetical protein
MGLEDFIKKQLREREKRAKSPEFLSAIKREKAEFYDSLNDLAKNTFQAGVTTLLKTPTKIFLNAFKVVYNDKYRMEDYFKEVFTLFFGKNGVAHSVIKVAANAVYCAGKGAKVGIRELLKV